MRKIYLFFLVYVFLLTGCASLSRLGNPAPSAKSQELLSQNQQTPSVAAKTARAPVPGIVFAKTIFEGVVKTSYVRLSLVEQSLPDKIIHLYIGDKMRQQDFPWISETVSPDYFIIELPPGSYRMTAIAIPVGTTMAEELLDIAFDVESAKAIYLGTLRVKGTHEKVRLGGIPLIRPGFDYEVHIADEKAPAILEFRRRLPKFTGEIKTKLMQVNPGRHFDLLPGAAR